MSLFGGVSSKSATTTNTSNPTAIAESGGSASNYFATGKAKVNAGLQVNAAKNSTVNIVTTDSGAIAASNKLVSDVIAQQASLTRQSVAGYGELAMTKLTDGANLTSKSTNIAIIAIGGIGAVIALAIWLKR